MGSQLQSLTGVAELNPKVLAMSCRFKFVASCQVKQAKVFYNQGDFSSLMVFEAETFTTNWWFVNG